MQYNTNWYWEQTSKQNTIIVPTCTIVYPCLDVMEVTELKQTPNNECTINQTHKALQRCLISLTDSNHDYICD